MNILEQIVAHKKLEVAESKNKTSIAELERNFFFAKPTLSLRQFLLDPNKTGIIAEFKRKSPSKGIINGNAIVEEVTGAYSKLGASGLSVLTDEHFFGGTLNDLLLATANETPLLRKDFMIDEYQIIEAKAHGAEVILLIAACLTTDEVKQFATVAKNIGLEVLLEIHNEAELAHICDEVDLVGVNNRNLKNFDVSVQISIDLAKQIPDSKIKISESGIDHVDTINLLRTHGYKGFLMGEQFMKQSNPGLAFQQFTENLKSTI
jgi:indole-3-glycerol phosphate synthase